MEASTKSAEVEQGRSKPQENKLLESSESDHETFSKKVTNKKRKTEHGGDEETQQQKTNVPPSESEPSIETEEAVLAEIEDLKERKEALELLITLLEERKRVQKEIVASYSAEEREQLNNILKTLARRCGRVVDVLEDDEE